MFLQTAIDPAYEDINEVREVLEDKKDYMVSSNVLEIIFEGYDSTGEVVEDALMKKARN